MSHSVSALTFFLLSETYLQEARTMIWQQFSAYCLPFWPLAIYSNSKVFSFLFMHRLLLFGGFSSAWSDSQAHLEHLFS